MNTAYLTKEFQRDLIKRANKNAWIKTSTRPEHKLIFALVIIIVVLLVVLAVHLNYEYKAK